MYSLLCTALLTTWLVFDPQDDCFCRIKSVLGWRAFLFSRSPGLLHSREQPGWDWEWALYPCSHPSEICLRGARSVKGPLCRELSPGYQEDIWEGVGELGEAIPGALDVQTPPTTLLKAALRLTHQTQTETNMTWKI